MKTLIITTLLFFALFTLSTQAENMSIKSQNVSIPTGTATPTATPEQDPTQNFTCNYYVANWGKANWAGTKAKPWNYRFYHRKRLPAGTWVCDVSNNLGEVNGQ